MEHKLTLNHVTEAGPELLILLSTPLKARITARCYHTQLLGKEFLTSTCSFYAGICGQLAERDESSTK